MEKTREELIRIQEEDRRIIEKVEKEYIRKPYTINVGNIEPIEMKKNMGEEDRNMWSKSKWAGMSFTREPEWDRLVESWKTGYPYASPVFTFENGDRAAIDRQGNIIEL